LYKRKLYAIENGFVTPNSLSFSPDSGWLFENMVYMQLRWQKKEIYNFSGKTEGDFVVFDKGKFSELFQVCFNLGNKNLDRELAVITKAMELFDVKTGSIINGNQTYSFIVAGKPSLQFPFINGLWLNEIFTLPSQLFTLCTHRFPTAWCNQPLIAKN
jgi:uncharacterized protein